MSVLKKIGVMASVATVGCGLLGTGFASAKANSGSTAPVSVSMFETMPPGVVNMNTNWMTKYVEKKFNMNINWNLVQTSDVTSKENVLVESGNYPDVFFDGSFTTLQALQYGKEGIFKPLNSLIKKYAPHVWHAIQTNAAFRAATVAPDGNIYGLPYYNVCTHCNWQYKMWMNGYYMKKFHLSLPTTTAQFEHVLEVFKQHNITPLTGYTGGWNSNPVPFLMDAFIYDDNTDYFDVKNGKITFAPTQPGWKAGLEYMHQLYQKGLLSADVFTQTYAQAQKLAAKNKVGTLPGGTANVAFPGTAGVPWQYWMNAVPPLKGPHGVQYATFAGANVEPSTICFAITNKASEAQSIAVMKLVNWLYTFKGLQMANYGPEGGKFWHYAKKGQKGLSGQQAYAYINNAAFSVTNQNLEWNQNFPMYQDLYERNNSGVATSSFDAQGSQSLLQLVTEEEYAGHQPAQVYPSAVWMSPTVGQQYSLEQTNINNYVTTWETNFIFGRKSFKSDWNQYVQGFQGLGLQQYLATAQKYMGAPLNTKPFQQDMKSVKYLLSLPESPKYMKWVFQLPQYKKYESWNKH